jgi:hypothetical protein
MRKRHAQGRAIGVGRRGRQNRADGVQRRLRVRQSRWGRALEPGQRRRRSVEPIEFLSDSSGVLGLALPDDARYAVAEKPFVELSVAFAKKQVDRSPLEPR